MFRLSLAFIALTLFSSDALAGHRLCPFGRARERIVHRERFVQRAPVLPRVLVPRLVPVVPLVPLAPGGCGAAGCPVPAMETGPAVLGTKPLTLPLKVAPAKK